MTENQIRFYVPHRGHSYPCIARIKFDQIYWIAMSRGTTRLPRILNDAGDVLAVPSDWALGFDELTAKLEFLTDILASGLPWGALVTCRHSTGLFGAIVEAAETRRVEVARPVRLPMQSRESSR